jgi:hypothetical protein
LYFVCLIWYSVVTLYTTSYTGVSDFKSECIVSNKSGEVMKGSKSKNNCYLWLPQDKNQDITWMLSKEDETKL